MYHPQHWCLAGSDTSKHLVKMHQDSFLCSLTLVWHLACSYPSPKPVFTLLILKQSSPSKTGLLRNTHTSMPISTPEFSFSPRHFSLLPTMSPDPQLHLPSIMISCHLSYYLYISFLLASLNKVPPSNSLHFLAHRGNMSMHFYAVPTMHPPPRSTRGKHYGSPGQL